MSRTKGSLNKVVQPKKSCRVEVRCTELEHVRLVDQAKQRGLTLTDHILDRCASPWE